MVYIKYVTVVSAVIIKGRRRRRHTRYIKPDINFSFLLSLNVKSMMDIIT